MPHFKNFGLILWHEGQDRLVLTERSTAAFTVVSFFIWSSYLYLTFWIKKCNVAWESIIFSVRIWFVLSFSLTIVILFVIPNGYSLINWCPFFDRTIYFHWSWVSWQGTQTISTWTFRWKEHQDNSACLLCTGYRWNKQTMDLYETVNKPGQLNPDTMKVNYSMSRLGATTRRAGKG